MKKVAVCGKFDGLHEGHLEFLRHARKLGDELYAVIIPDYIVLENTGQLPTKSAEQRRKEVIGSDIITDAYIDCMDNGLSSMLELKPDIFVFGYDQDPNNVERWKQRFSSMGLYSEYIRLGLYNNGTHSSDLKRRAE